MADLGKVMVTPKGDYSPEATYERLDLVTHHGSGYIALQDVTGIEPSDDGINWQLHAKGCKDASELPVMDTYNLLETELASETNGQALLDAIADRVANKLIAKAALANNTTTTEAGVTALDAAVGKTLQDQITQLNSDLSIKSTTVTRTTDEFGLVGWDDVLPTGSKTVNVIVSSTDAIVALNGNSYGYVYRSTSATNPVTRLRNTSVDLTITYQ